MTAAPPTIPIPVHSTARHSFAPRVLMGAGIHVALVLLTCFITPLVMASNIWPIAGAFWAVMTCPVAAGTGALTAWLTRRSDRSIALPVIIVTGIAVAALAAVVMFNNR